MATFVAEGRALNSYWRGYLLAGNYAPSTILGCPAKSYVGQVFYASHNGGGAVNHVETIRDAASFRMNPAYIWYGRGTYNAENVRQLAGGNLAGPSYPSAGDYDTLGPLMTCPQVWIEFKDGKKTFEPSHRPKLRVVDPPGMHTVPYAENVGFNDGSVRFFFGPGGGIFNPL